ncbi:MAG: restriction endonuclease subunit S, partial [Ruminococcus sp.]|nr:restriction endonuclease subunit S [Ruminococcus sp.]
GRKNIANTKLYYPCLEEQQKIADFLSAFDNTISYAKQELDKWKELKKGFMQKMLV